MGFVIQIAQNISKLMPKMAKAQNENASAHLIEEFLNAMTLLNDFWYHFERVMYSDDKRLKWR